MFTIYAHCPTGYTEYWASTRTLESARRRAQKALDENPLKDGGGIEWMEIFGPGIEESESVERPPVEPKFKVGDDALARDGHKVRIVGLRSEGGVEFAAIEYLDGYLPYDPAGRLCGSAERPIWEHRVEDGKVVRSGGDYYNEADWIVEEGLRRIEEA